MNLKKLTAKLPPCMLGGGKRFGFFVQDIISDLKLFVFLLAVLFLYRALFIYFFRAELAGAASCGDVWLALWYGLRLSLKTAAAFIIPAFVLGTLLRQVLPKWPSLKIKFYIGALEIFILSLLFQTRLPYYKEFHNAFDPFIFNTFNDDVLAIADSAIKQYNAPLRILMGLLSAAALTWLWKKWLSARLLPKNFPDGVKHKALIVWTIIIFIPVFAVYMRYGGSFNYNGSIYWKNSARMSSHLLNEAILDDVQALYKASRIHRNLRKIQNADYSPEEIRQTLSDLAGANYQSSSLLPFLEKTARGAAEKPEHIFLIIGETYMLWPMLEEYSYLGAAEGMKALASSEKGAMLKHFLPAANGTMFGLASTGLHLFQLLGCNAVGSWDQFRSLPEGEHMLHIQLQGIELVVGHVLHQLQQGLQGADPAPGNVVVEAAVWKIRGVLDLQTGHGLLGKKLTQGLNGVKSAGFRFCGDANSVLTHSQAVALPIAAGNSNRHSGAVGGNRQLIQSFYKSVIQACGIKADGLFLQIAIQDS